MTETPHKEICKHCGNDTFRIYWDRDTKQDLAVDMIQGIVCSKCGKEN